VRNRIQRDCPVCGRTYEADVTRLANGRQTTCSRECSYASRAQNRSTSKPYACAVCGTQVLRSPSKVKSAFVFCSPACHYQGRSLGFVRRTVREPYRVTDAGREAWREAGRRRRGQLRKEPVEWACEVCGRVRSIPRGDLAPARRLRFCSPECANRAMRGDGNPAWRGGHPEYYGPDWRPLQRLARKLDQYECQRCGVSQADLGRSLDVHHIRPVSSFEDANTASSIDNVVSLCHGCHMIVEWNGVDFELPERCRQVTGDQARP
jgi:HNH endonuclease